MWLLKCFVVIMVFRWLLGCCYVVDKEFWWWLKCTGGCLGVAMWLLKCLVVVMVFRWLLECCYEEFRWLLKVFWWLPGCFNAVPKVIVVARVLIGSREGVLGVARAFGWLLGCCCVVDKVFGGC